jgi:hypothetical protein
MAALGGQVLTMFCGFTLTLIMFSLMMAAQSLPTILKLLQELLRSLIQLSASGYRIIIELVYPAILNHKHWWILACITLSLLLCAGITVLLLQHLIKWPFILAFFHGLVVGIEGDSDDNHHLHLGIDP